MPRSIEQIRKAKREQMARKRAADPEAARAYGRQYHAANRTKQTAKMRAYYGRRFFWGKAMKLRGEDRATARQVASLWKQQRGLCALTGRRLDRSAQLDHKTPKAKGGSDRIENLQWLCESVNLAKRDLTDAEFAALCASVMRWIGERIAEVEAFDRVVASSLASPDDAKTRRDRISMSDPAGFPSVDAPSDTCLGGSPVDQGRGGAAKVFGGTDIGAVIETRPTHTTTSRVLFYAPDDILNDAEGIAT